MNALNEEFYKGFTIKEVKRAGDNSMFSRVVGYDVYVSGLNNIVIHSNRSKNDLKKILKGLSPKEVRKTFLDTGKVVFYNK